MSKGFQKKNKKADKQLLKWRYFWRMLRLAVATAVFVVALVLLVFYLFLFFRSLVDTTVGYVDAKVLQEQTDSYAVAKKILLDIRKNIWLVDEQIGNLEENKALTIEQKKQLNSELKRLDENSELLKQNFEHYFDDFTIQSYPRSSSEITSFIYETKNFSMAIDRFDRTLELNLFLTQSYRSDQVELILDDYYDLIWYLGKLGMIRDANNK